MIITRLIDEFAEAGMELENTPLRFILLLGAIKTKSCSSIRGSSLGLKMGRIRSD